jgi:hypothetical protein
MAEFVGSALFELSEGFWHHLLTSIDEYVQWRSLLHYTIPYNTLEHALSHWHQPCGRGLSYMRCRFSVRHLGIYDSFLSHLPVLQAISVANIATLSLPVRGLHSPCLGKV